MPTFDELEKETTVNNIQNNAFLKTGGTFDELEKETVDGKEDRSLFESLYIRPWKVLAGSTASLLQTGVSTVTEEAIKGFENIKTEADIQGIGYKPKQEETKFKDPILSTLEQTINTTKSMLSRRLGGALKPEDEEKYQEFATGIGLKRYGKVESQSEEQIELENKYKEFAKNSIKVSLEDRKNFNKWLSDNGYSLEETDGFMMKVVAAMPSVIGSVALGAIGSPAATAAIFGLVEGQQARLDYYDAMGVTDETIVKGDLTGFAVGSVIYATEKIGVETTMKALKLNKVANRLMKTVPAKYLTKAKESAMADLGKRATGAFLSEGTQEFAQSTLSDIIQNVAGSQAKSVEDIISDGIESFAIGGVLGSAMAPVSMLNRPTDTKLRTLEMPAKAIANTIPVTEKRQRAELKAVGIEDEWADTFVALEKEIAVSPEMQAEINNVGKFENAEKVKEIVENDNNTYAFSEDYSTAKKSAIKQRAEELAYTQAELVSPEQVRQARVNRVVSSLKEQMGQSEWEKLLSTKTSGVGALMTLIQEQKGMTRAGTLKEVKELQKRAVILIQGLPISKENKSKFLNSISSIQPRIDPNATQEYYNKVADNIIDRAERLLTSEIKDIYIEAITTELTESKTKTINSQIKQGKFDYKTTKELKSIRKFFSMNKAQAEQAIENADFLSDENSNNNYFMQDLLEKISYLKFFGKKSSDEYLYDQVFTAISKLKDLGRRSKTADDFIKKMNQLDDRKEALGLIEANENKDKSKFQKVSEKVSAKIDLAIGDLGSMLNTVFGKDFADRRNLGLDQSMESVGVHQKRTDFSNTVSEIYDTTINKLHLLFYQMRTDNVIENITGRLNPNDQLNINRLQLISIRNEILDEKRYKDYESEYGKLNMARIVDQIALMSEQDIAFADYLLDFYKGYYKEVNPFYIRRFGKDLGNRSFYSPTHNAYNANSKEERAMNSFSGPKTIPNYAKERLEGTMIPAIWKTDAVNDAMAYILEAENIKYVSENYLKLSRIIKDAAIEKKIQDIYGKKFYSLLKEAVDQASLSGTQKTSDALSSWYNKYLANYVKAKVSLSPAIFTKQLISVINFSEGIDKADYFKYLFEGLKSPKQTKRFMQKLIPYINTRYETGASNEQLAMAMELETQKMKDYSDSLLSKAENKVGYNEITMTEFMTWTQRAGDLGPWIYGGYARYKHLTEEKGFTDQEAMAEIVEQGIKTQQANFSTMLSGYQRGGGIQKALVVFTNTPQQYARVMKNAELAYSRGDISGKDFSEIMMIYGVINPILFGSTTWAFGSGGWNFLVYLFHGDDLEPSDWWSLVGYIGYSILSSPVNAVPIFKQIVDPYLQKLIFKKAYGFNLPLIHELSNLGSSLKKDNSNAENVFKEALISIAEIKTGKPLGTVDRYIKKAAQVAKGERIKPREFRFADSGSDITY